MSEQRADHVSICIEEELTSLTQTDTITGKPFIFKVDDLLRRVNEKAYEPAILSIGPYHHGKDKFKMMEEHKLRYLQQLLKRRNESSVDAYIMMLNSLEEKARKCYGESISSLDKDGFVKMMLLDGCFIIELFRKLKMEELRDKDDPIFQGRILNVLGRDLILFENQIPFFLLAQLFSMTKLPGPDDTGIAGMIETALKFLGKKLQGSGGVIQASPRISFHKVDHLLGLVHHNWSPSFVQNIGNQEDKCQSIECASDLKRAGINFIRAKNSTSLFDIKFENSPYRVVMKIPPLIAEEETECLLSNLIAYEQYNHLNLCDQVEYVTNYATFMDCLINSAEDIEHLCKHGIVKNRFTDAAAASVMFNKLRCNVIINPRNHFCYSQAFEDVNEYYKKPWSNYKAMLIRDYFSSPWKAFTLYISLFSIALAIIQVVIPLRTNS